MRGKYRLIYLSAFLLFVIVNIAAIFIVFKKYHSTNKASQAVTTTKFRYSKVKEKIAQIESKIHQVKDSTQLIEFQSIQLDKMYLDSILTFDQLNAQSLSVISHKIYDIASKSNQLEQNIDANIGQHLSPISN